MKKLIAAIGIAGAALTSTAITAGAAHASTAIGPTSVTVTALGSSHASQGTHSALAAHPNAGWLGACTFWADSNTFGGWCNGNGPDSYRAWADCADGSVSYGVVHWDGDRRGSYAYCAGHGGLLTPNNTYSAYEGYIYYFS